MGQNGILASPTQEKPGRMCNAAIRNDQRFQQSPKEDEDHCLRTDMSQIKGKGFQPHPPNDADAESREITVHVKPSFSCTKGDGNYPETSQDICEDSRGLSGSHSQGKVAPSAGTEASAGRQGAAVSKPDVWVQDSLESHVDTNLQEALKLNEALKSVFQRLETDVRVQKYLCCKKESEVAALERENQNLQGCVADLRSRVAQVTKSQEMVSKIETEFQKLCQDPEKFPWDAVLEQDIGKTIGQIYLDNRGLREDLRKCHSKIEQLNENKLTIEVANRKLEQMVEMIQQQLCKEKSGQHGSYVDGSLTPFLLESTAKDMFTSIATFTSLFSKYRDWHGNPSAQNLVLKSEVWKRGVQLSRNSHWTYFLKSIICNSLFDNFQSEIFAGLGNAVLFLGHEERVAKCVEYYNSCKGKGAWDRAISSSRDRFGYLFFEYLASRSLALLPWDIQPLIFEVFQNHAELIGVRLHERLSQLPINKQKLLQSLIVAVEKVWQLHKLCLSFEPPATIFGVSRGDPFNQDYMEATDVVENDDTSFVPTVSFMTYPGFRLRKSIIKCEVYLCN